MSGIEGIDVAWRVCVWAVLAMHKCALVGR